MSKPHGNKGRKRPDVALRNSNDKKFGIKHHNWKGDGVGYVAIHDWVKRQLGKPQKCEVCLRDNLVGRQIHWASKKHDYLRDVSGWVRLCTACHRKYDNLLRRYSVDFLLTFIELQK